jgi:hypothetical protein
MAPRSATEKTEWILNRASFMSDRPSPKARYVTHRLVTHGGTEGELFATWVITALRTDRGLRTPPPSAGEHLGTELVVATAGRTRSEGPLSFGAPPSRYRVMWSGQGGSIWAASGEPVVPLQTVKQPILVSTAGNPRRPGERQRSTANPLSNFGDWALGGGRFPDVSARRCRLPRGGWSRLATSWRCESGLSVGDVFARR